MSSKYCSTCKSADCSDPDHVKKAFTPENDGDLSKITQQMSKNLIAQLEGKESMEKAMNAAAAAGFAKDYNRFKGYANTTERPIRHSGESANVRALVIPPTDTIRKSEESNPCGNCGCMVKQGSKCSKCMEKSKIKEAKGWRQS